MAVTKFASVTFTKATGSTSSTTFNNLSSISTQAAVKGIAEATLKIKNATGIKNYTLGQKETWDYGTE